MKFGVKRIAHQMTIPAAKGPRSHPDSYCACKGQTCIHRTRLVSLTFIPATAPTWAPISFGSNIVAQDLSDPLSLLSPRSREKTRSKLEPIWRTWQKIVLIRPHLDGDADRAI
jgi:hypothetical protein